MATKRSLAVWAHMWCGLVSVDKGQLISTGLFGTFNSSKNELNQFNLRYHGTLGCFFVDFLEELKTSGNSETKMTLFE